MSLTSYQLLYPTILFFHVHALISFSFVFLAEHKELLSEEHIQSNADTDEISFG
jgi:hypothetical protein